MLSNIERADRCTVTPPKLNGSTFGQRRDDIFKRLQHIAEQCQLNYSGRNELASESDEIVSELCDALEDAFSYGLHQQHSTITTAANLFQNMQEIVIGNTFNSSGTPTFWDFCQVHLTPDEIKRYMSLKQVNTKYGRGMAFIRTALNEKSLQRYLLTWLNDEDLQRYYSPWSLLLDGEISKELSKIVGCLNNILFALKVDSKELNTSVSNVVRKEEPIIYAPAPIPVVTVKHKRKTAAIERPIATENDDFLKNLREMELPRPQLVTATAESVASIEDLNLPPTDSIEPELEFLKQPIDELCKPNKESTSQCLSYCSSAGVVQFDTTSIDAVGVSENDDDKSDTSSQYSKSSSALSASHAQCDTKNASLEEKLREMNERCVLLETRVAQLSLKNRQLVRRLKQQFNESGIHPSSSLTTHFLITIPHATLLKSQHGRAYYTYEIHITMRQNLEYWSLNKRYREFYKLHKSLLKTHPSVAAIELPPKKHFGNMNLVFVEERRQQLQIYLLNLVEMLPQVEACKSKAELTKVFPFFRER